jgi:hypothetical protein
MIADVETTYLLSKLKTYSYILKEYLDQINSLEKDTKMSNNEKFLKIKKIREELIKVSIEIDNIKKQFNLVKHYNVN